MILLLDRGLQSSCFEGESLLAKFLDGMKEVVRCLLDYFGYYFEGDFPSRHNRPLFVITFGGYRKNILEDRRRRWVQARSIGSES